MILYYYVNITEMKITKMGSFRIYLFYIEMFLVLPACFHCWNLQYKKHRQTHAAQDKASVDRMALIQTSLMTISSYINLPWTFTARCVPLRRPPRTTVFTTVVVTAMVCVATVVVVVRNNVGSMVIYKSAGWPVDYVICFDAVS